MDSEVLRSCAKKVRGMLPAAKPKSALLLGSGWGDAVADIRHKQTIPYAEIPGMGVPAVQGHYGRLILAEAGGAEILVFQGRRHWYEGEGWEPVAIPICICTAMEVPVLVVTNAAGAVNRDLVSGDLMLITDHINAMGTNPLIGPHDPAWGPRFPDQSQVYDSQLRELIQDCAAACGIELQDGVYAATTGPTYETPAEVEMLRNMGADAVGMSTVPEAILANAAGLRVAALSCITNCAAGAGNSPLSHDEVVAMTNECMPRMRALITELANRLALSGD